MTIFEQINQNADFLVRVAAKPEIVEYESSNGGHAPNKLKILTLRSGRKYLFEQEVHRHEQSRDAVSSETSANRNCEIRFAFTRFSK